MASAPPAFTGLSLNEIKKIVNRVRNTDTMYLTPYAQRHHTQRVNFWNAILLLYVLDGVTFPNLCLNTFQDGDTTAQIQIGSWRLDLYGQRLYGYVASLEDNRNYSDYMCLDSFEMCFESFDELVAYIKTVIAKQAA